MKVFYFGPWGGPGHLIWTPDGHSARGAGPWSVFDLDAVAVDYRGRATGRGFVPADPEQRQGVWLLTSAPGWTALGAYDRTCDTRGNSIAVFVAEGEHDAEGMKRIAAEHFPAVWARITGGAS